MTKLLANRKIYEPLSVSPASRYGITALGGLIDRGTIIMYPTIGADIQFSPSTRKGTVDILRYADVKDTVERGDWHILCDKVRAKIRSIITDKMSQTTDNEDDKERTTFKSSYELEKILFTDIINSIIKELYEKFPKRSIIGEGYYVGGFISDTTVKGQGAIGTVKLSDEFTKESEDLGFEYYVKSPLDTYHVITRIRVNKSIWQEWMLHLGISRPLGIINWLYYHDVHAQNQQIIKTIEDVFNILDRISQNPMMNKVPELADYLTDHIITYQLWNLTALGLKREEWIYESEYTITLPEANSQAAMIMIENIASTWNKSQVELDSADMSPKSTLRVLPFTDQEGKYFERIQDVTNKDLDDESIMEPWLNFTKLVYNVKQSDPLNFVRIRTINAMPDGAEKSNAVIFNRYLGWIGSLNDETSQLSLSYIQPWVLGRERPIHKNMSFEREFWPIVYLDSDSMLKAPLEVKNLTEAYLYGLRSFLGPKNYLFKPGDHVKDKITILQKTKDDKSRGFTLTPSMFSELVGGKFS
jgi:hypothetical protein